MQHDTDDPVAAVGWLVRGHWVALAVRAAAELGVFDHLDRPRGLDELAAAIGSDRSALARLLQTLQDLGLVERDGTGSYAATPMGETLRSGHPSAMRELSLMQTDAANVASWTRLADAVRSNAGVFEGTNGVSVWDHIAADADRAAHFNAAMARRGLAQASAIRTACDLQDVGMIVDVGGGKGGMVAALLLDDPRPSAIVADLPHVAADADKAFAAAGLGDRARGVAADFFDSVPASGDAYVVSNVLHDWMDDECIAILRTVRAAMKSTARLWIVEMALDAPDRTFEQSRDLHLLDLHMLVLFGARERTLSEYGELLHAAGFDRGVLLDSASPWNVIEARPA